MVYIEHILRTLGTIGTHILTSLSVEGIIALPSLMVGFLVAIAIYNFEDSHKGLEIDAPTIMSKVVRVDSVLIAIFLVSLLPIAWGNKTPVSWLIPVFTILYLIGLFMLTEALKRAFNWAKSVETSSQDSFRTAMRVEYMSSLKDKEKRVAWEKIWSTGKRINTFFNEGQLIKLFTKSVKDITDKKLYSPWLVQDFITVLDTIHVDNPVIMESLIDFNLDALLDQPSNVTKKLASGELYYYSFQRQLFFKILDKSIADENSLFYMLVARSRKYIKEHNLSEVEFIKLLTPNFLINVEKLENQYQIWEVFPDDWKVTLNNLLDPSTKDVAFAWLNAYSNWLSGKSLYNYGGRKELDFSIDDITNALFPTVDTIQFSKLFAFEWGGYGVNEGESSEHAQIRNALENQLTFGHVGHSFTTTTPDGRELKMVISKEYEELIDLISRINLFPSLHDKKQTRKYIKAIKDLLAENKDDKDTTRSLQWFDMVFKDVRKRINSLNKKQVLSATKNS